MGVAAWSLLPADNYLQYNKGRARGEWGEAKPLSSKLSRGVGDG